MITKKAASFEIIWPETFRRAVGTLRRKGIETSAAEDAVQEAGARAIAIDVAFTDVDDLLRWIQTVAWRVVLDVRKHEARLVYTIPELESADDTERIVESRARLDRLRELMRNLSVDERDALTTNASAMMTRRDSVRLAVRRHRVRTRLLGMLDGLALVLAWLRRIATTRGKKATWLAATPLIAISIVMIGPTLRHPPSGASTPILRTAVDEWGLVSPVTERAPMGVELSVTASDRRQLGPPSRAYPSFEFRHDGPNGEGALFGRPKAPTDELVCVDAPLLGHKCTHLKIRLTR